MTSRYAEDIPYECGAGWNDLLDDTLDQLFAVDPDISILQVKEKFGSLTVYYHTEYAHGTPQAMLIGTAVKAAERHSKTVCEQCGLPGELMIKNHRLFTVCEKHIQEGMEPDTDD